MNILEEFLKELNKTLEQMQFVWEKSDHRHPYDYGVLTGIELCIQELKKRLEDI